MTRPLRDSRCIYRLYAARTLHTPAHVLFKDGFHFDVLFGAHLYVKSLSNN